MPRTPAARARGISKHHGDVVALDGVDLDVEAGRVHGLVGPNGAGKTTMLGLLLGVAPHDAGTLEILGRPVGRALAVPDGVAGFVDGPALYPSLTARQNLTALAALRGTRSGRSRLVQDALDRVGLEGVADVRVRGYSLGMRQRLGLAAALLARPRLLVLDEPANGLDPVGTRQVDRVIGDLVAEGVAVVLSSHRMDELAALCDDVTILATGRVAYSGSLADLADLAGAVEHRLVTSDPGRARAVVGSTPDLPLVDGTDGRREGGGRDGRDAGTAGDVGYAGDVGAGRTGAAVGYAGSGRSRNDGALLVHGPAHALDDLVVRLVRAGVALRELTPVTTPLEAAFLALTGDGHAEALADPDAEADREAGLRSRADTPLDGRDHPADTANPADTSNPDGTTTPEPPEHPEPRDRPARQRPRLPGPARARQVAR